MPSYVREYHTSIILVGIAIVLTTSCSSPRQKMPTTQGTIELITSLYDTAGFKTVESPAKFWYRDSNVIQEIREIRMNDSSGIKTVDYLLIKYVYVNLTLKVASEYLNLSDTAKPIKQSSLPDTTLEMGWSFYSQNLPKMKDTPEILNDTLIDNIFYKRIKFHLNNRDSLRYYKIGYLRCDGRNSMFSFEKKYTATTNCNMIKSYGYFLNHPHPFISQEVMFDADTLSRSELNIFDAWDKNAVNYKLK